jgi:group I intron endonuclease
MWIIYKVTFSNGKVYIGQTSRSLETRRHDHLTDAKYEKPNKRAKFHHALLKHDDHTWEQIDTAETLEEALQKEAKYIEEFDAIKSGYNCKTYRNGVGALSDETRKKIAEQNSKHSHLSWKENLPRREALSEKMKRRHQSGEMDDAKAKIALTRCTKEQRDKSSQDSLKRYQDKEAREKMATACGGRPFLVYKDNQLVGRFVSQSEAAKSLNLNRAHISNCLKKRRNTLHGYSFEYEPETDSIMKCKN